MKIMQMLRRLWKRLNGVDDSYEGYRDALIKRIVDSGGHVGSNVDIYNAKIDMTNPYLITIGDNVTITNATILTHDACLKKKTGYTFVSRVTIGSNVFIGFNTTVLPGTTIGDNVVIGAGSVVHGTIPSNSVAAGNPCRVLKSYDELVAKRTEMMQELPVFELGIEGLLQDAEARSALCEAGSGFML